MSAGPHSIQRFRMNPDAYTRVGHERGVVGPYWEMTCSAPHALRSGSGRCGSPIDGLTGLTFDEVSALAREDLANGVERLCARHQAEQDERADRERSEQARETEIVGADA